MYLVLGMGLEPTRFNHTHLKRARLPIPPPERGVTVATLNCFYQLLPNNQTEVLYQATYADADKATQAQIS